MCAVKTYDGVMTATRAKVTNSGQVSLPASIRRRWDAGSVIVVDRGDYVIVRPVPADPIAALKGIYAADGPSLEDRRRIEREAEEDQENRRNAR